MSRPPPPSWSYGAAVPGHSPGAGGFYPPGYFHPNANQQYAGNVQYTQLLPYPPQPTFPNPRVVQPHNTFSINAGYTAARPSPVPSSTLGMVERAAAKVHEDLVASGENVSAWMVSQSVLAALRVDSWSSLGFQPQDVPSLHRLLLMEGKVNAFIHCFVFARKIASMHELEISICQNEGVRQFEELGLGPFLQQPLVKEYFTYSSALKEVFKITSEDIVLSLQEFMSKSKKKVSAEKFLRFLAEQKSVSKDKLGVRIQDLRFYISQIQEVSKAECTVFREKMDGSHNIALEKQILDKRFDYISSCVKTFSSECNELDGKHVYFNVSDDCDDCNDCNESKEDDISGAYKCDAKDKTSLNNYQSLSPVKGHGQLLSSCPYPSKTEEMVRLGLKPAESYKTLSATAPAPAPSKTQQTAFRRKRKKESKDSKICKYIKKEEAAELKVYDQTSDLTLHNGDVEKFVATWKVACGEYSVSEVLDTMLNFYVEKVRKREKIRKFASSYPIIGMLNVAIVSIKRGMFESIYDTFQALSGKEIIGTDSVGSGEMIEVMPMLEVGDPTLGAHCGSRVTVDDIIKKVSNYFDNNQLTSKEMNLSPEKQLQALKKFYDCEVWLLAQFNVQEFRSLGHGNFCEFLENHIKILPQGLHAVLSKELFGASSVEVCLIQHQISVMLSQAEGNLMDKDGTSSFDYVSVLKKQFPTASFCLIGVDPQKHFEKLINMHKESINSSCVLFSTCLIGNQSNQNSLRHTENSSLDMEGIETKVAQHHSSRRTSKDAVECLLNSPMLEDLLSWSHWELIYAPSLGPLSDFLFKQVNYKNLLCIATVDGKFVRVDPTATVDKFLEAFVQCSSFNIALNFLSLICLYRGINNSPLSLLKRYAQKAVSVIMQNCTDLAEIDVRVWNFIPGHIVRNNDDIKECNENTDGRSFSAELCIVNDAISTVSRTILECLKYLPSEFRSFAAEIFLAGFWSITKEAPVVILNQCSQTDERIMLHDIGFSLGVTEWIADQQIFISSSTHDLSVHVSKISGSGIQNITHGKITGDLVGGNSRFSSGASCATSKIVVESGDVDKTQAICDSSRKVISISEEQMLHDATAIVESIRQEEFGLNSNSNNIEDSLLKKQHARLGRALHCLSQELYSQDSHFILELVQNADDNIYPNDVEPELVFILQESGIVVLNNELGFSTENIRALCDVGNSTKKESCGGYIGKKGIGFKSVFRVTDAPEIHSNGFHVKFDITEGQIGFVLPTVIPPYDASTFRQYLCVEDYQVNGIAWNTCIILPFRSESKGTGVSSILSMFSDIHPSLLLFLHRLRCIKFRNLITDRLIVMRKETLHNGIVKVSHGEEVMSWLVISKKLRSSVIRTDVDATDISMAFTLQESDCGEYQPILRNQPVFSFLPLRNYGLKFILQGDFVLPSSREEVDGSSAWNQWLLSEFPALFLSAKQSFCDLPCFLKNPGKAVTMFMSFVPLVGEVHGFFSQLPQMIISLLRVSNCLLQDSCDLAWLLPCRVLRGWNEQVRLLLSDHLLQRHLRLVYLHKDVKLSDTLAANIGVRDYGPKVLVDVIESICHSPADLKSLGIDWLSAWLSAVSSSLSMNLSRHASLNDALEVDIINDLRNIPFIPLADCSYGCVADAPIWLPCDIQNIGSKGEYHTEDFPCLYNKLRIVNPHLFSVATKNAYSIEAIKADTVMQMLIKIGVQQLSAHTVITSHILAALSEKHTAEDQNLMIEYLSFIMLHLQTDCVSCHSEKPEIMAELSKLPILLTNHGFKCPSRRPIHFGREYGNPVDVVVLLDAVDIKWVEVDSSYLKHPSTLRLVSGSMKWRSFFLDLGVTDFVQVICTNKNVEDFFPEDTVSRVFNSATSYVMDWESHELVNLLSIFSSKKFRTKCILLLEVLDKMWDDNYSAQSRSFVISKIDGAKKPVVSSFMKSIYKFSWVASTMDMDLHQPKSLFYGCEQVHAVLGTMGPYVVPKVNSKALVNDFRFKTEVSIDDAVEIVQFWTKSNAPFTASIAQMSNFYTLISSAINISSSKILKELIPSSFIFVPFIESCQSSASGVFLSSKEVHWQDPTGCVDRMKKAMHLCGSSHKGIHILCCSLETVYPTLRDFFVNICGVPVTPSFCSYFQILQQLSGIALPSQASHEVFRVMVRWADDLKSGLVSPDQLSELKKNIAKVENTVLPTEQDKWVSLHPSFGLICWSDDDELKKQFKHSEGVDFIQFGELSVEENLMLSSDVANLFRIIGVPALSEVVSREAILYGAEDNRDKVSLVNWIIRYAQRYIHKLHLETYLKLKQMGLERINQLQVVVVKKLFYKYILQGHECALKRRFECSCLLQGNILYTCQSADSHSMFLELSRFFFNGSPQLHLANFLHMAATMALSGSTDQQIEFFIVNSQKIPELPDDETPWSIQSVCEVEEPQIPVLPTDHENGTSKCSHRKPGTSSQWPPADWKFAPDFEYFRKRNLHRRPSKPSPYDSLQADSSNVAGENVITRVDEPVSVEITGNWTVEEISMPVGESPLLTSLSDSASDPASHFEEHDGKSGPRSRMPNPARFFEREVLNRKTDKISAQCQRTGRLGEMLAYQYFTDKLGSADVRWVNKDTETGLPYDLVVGENEMTQYIEVKATVSAAKDWFDITTREWNFAAEMEDSYSIAHVAILGSDKANVTIMKNPYKLCHERVLSLAVIMPRR